MAPSVDPRRVLGGHYRCVKFGWDWDCSFEDMLVFSKRQRITLRLLYAMSRPSVVCLSVVCDVGAPYSGG